MKPVVKVLVVTAAVATALGAVLAQSSHHARPDPTSVRPAAPPSHATSAHGGPTGGDEVVKPNHSWVRWPSLTDF
jgi:hypothetical protein